MADLSDIARLLSHRGDLSTFIVHLTKDARSRSAKSNLKRILKDRTLLAKNPFGPATHSRFGLGTRERRTQRCVSFSETPLEHIHCLACAIPGRQVKLSSFGLAFTKIAARQRGVNPVWYVDITPGGHEWLMNSVNRLIEKEANRGKFKDSEIAKLCPFIEQMGTGQRQDGFGYRKEFWWEREWRHRGDFSFGYFSIAFGLSPEEDIEELELYTRKLMRREHRRIRFIDPNWNVEKMIARLCGCMGPLTPFDDSDW